MTPTLDGMNDDGAQYELLAVPNSGDGTAARLLGWCQAYEEALRVRDDDVIGQLAARGGRYTQVEHVIVGSGLQGPRTLHRLATGLGVDPAGGTVPNAGDRSSPGAGWRRSTGRDAARLADVPAMLRSPSKVNINEG